MFKKCSVIHRMDSNASKVTQVSSSSFCNDFSIGFSLQLQFILKEKWRKS